MKTLPEFSIGKSGHDFFSSHKDLTIVMVPFERFSIFPQAVDTLFKTIHIPFNLIVVEGNAPESVRTALEWRAKKHKNISLLYSNHFPSIYSAFNLALPHMITKYAFMMVNDVKMTAGSLERLLSHAEQHQCDVVCPKSSLVLRCVKNADDDQNEKTIQSLGLRPAFLMSQKGIQKIRKFDGSMDSFLGGIDFAFSVKQKSLNLCMEPNTFLASYWDRLNMAIDFNLHAFQWNADQIYQTAQRLEKKWNIRLAEDSYTDWLKHKVSAHEEHPEFFRYYLKRLFALISKTRQHTVGLSTVKH